MAFKTLQVLLLSVMPWKKIHIHFFLADLEGGSTVGGRCEQKGNRAADLCTHKKTQQQISILFTIAVLTPMF